MFGYRSSGCSMQISSDLQMAQVNWLYFMKWFRMQNLQNVCPHPRVTGFTKMVRQIEHEISFLSSFLCWFLTYPGLTQKHSPSALCSIVPSTAASIEEDEDDLMEETLSFFSELCGETHILSYVMRVDFWISHDFLSYICGFTIFAYVIWSLRGFLSWFYGDWILLLSESLPGLISL